MLDRGRRLAARLLAVGLLAATLCTVDSLALPSPAEARCAGNGNPVVSSMSYGGVVRVSEDPVTGTCNENQTYTAVLEDRSADGNCVHIFFRETGDTWRPVASSCGGPGVRFTYVDNNGNSRAYEMFCLVRDAPPYPIVACGWGTSAGAFGQYFGTNYGY